MRSDLKDGIELQLQPIYVEYLSGQYKNCMNLLQKAIKNQSQSEKNFLHHHNYNVCEYSQNRSQLQAFATITKLTDLLNQAIQKRGTKKNKQEPYDSQMLKYNIAVLMAVIGRRDHTEMLLKDLYYNGVMQASWKWGFLLLQTQLLLGNKFECLPVLKLIGQQRAILRSIGDKDEKTCKIKFSGLSFPDNSNPDMIYSREEFVHLYEVFMTIVFIKFGLVKSALNLLPKKENNMKLWIAIKEGSYTYKNSNLFELNLLTMVKFASAQLEYEIGNYTKVLRLLNPSNLVEAEINSNRYWTGANHLALNNIGLINYKLGKETLALFYISKSLENLHKFSVVNADEKEQLICQHYQSKHEFVSYNQALMLLKVGKVKEAYEHFSNLQKVTKSYKFWYRFGEATLKFFHVLLEENAEINESELCSEIYDNHQPSYYYPNVPYVRPDPSKGKPQNIQKGPFYKRYVLHSVDHFIQQGNVEQSTKISKTQSSLLHLKAILDMAQGYFQNALIAIQHQNLNEQISHLNILNSFDPEVEAEANSKKVKQNHIKQHQSFKQSILIILAYISLCKEQYSKTIKFCKDVLALPDLSEKNGYTASMYLMEAYLETQHTKQALEVSENKFLKLGLKSPLQTYDFRDTLAASQTKIEKINPESVTKYNMAVLHIRSGNMNQANIIINKFLTELGIVPSTNSYKTVIPTYILNLLIYWNLRTDYPWGALQLIKHKRILSSPANNNGKALLKIVK